MKMYAYLTNAAEYAAGGDPVLSLQLDTHMDDYADWARITEVDIEMPQRSEFIAEAERQINKAERRTREEFERKMAVIQEQRSRLLAIGHDG